MNIGQPWKLEPGLSALMTSRARTFAFAARFLPREHRQAVVVLYAFCRTMDDLADDPPPGASPQEIRASIEAWREWLTSGYRSDPPEPAGLGPALQEVLERYQVPPDYLLALLKGVESDLGAVQMPDFSALYRYSSRVAGAVGLAMSHILGARQPEALVAANQLGIAMQLTNVLRDVGGDLRQNRIYLPADELAQFGYSGDRLKALIRDQEPPDRQFRSLMRFQVARTRSYYARSLASIWLLPAPARPGILIAGRLYRAILDVIEANGYDVLHRRAVTSRIRKTREALAALTMVSLWGKDDPAILDETGGLTFTKVPPNGVTSWSGQWSSAEDSEVSPPQSGSWEPDTR